MRSLLQLQTFIVTLATVTSEVFRGECRSKSLNGGWKYIYWLIALFVYWFIYHEAKKLWILEAYFFDCPVFAVFYARFHIWDPTGTSGALGPTFPLISSLIYSLQFMSLLRPATRASAERCQIICLAIFMNTHKNCWANNRCAIQTLVDIYCH